MNNRLRRTQEWLTLLCCIGLLLQPSRASGTEDAPSDEFRNVTQPDDASLNADDEVGPIVLSNMTIEHVLDLLQTYSGHVIIPAANLPKSKVSFKSAGKLRRDEAIHAVETLLRLNGVMLIRRGNRFIEAIPDKEALRVSPPVLIDDSEATLHDQQIIGRLFDMTYADANQVHKQIGEMLSGGGVSSSRHLGWRNAVIVFDTAQNMEKIAQVIEMLDKPDGQRADVMILPIQNSSARSVFYALNHAQRNRANAALYRARFHVDRGANHIVVVAPPESQAYIEELVNRLDREIAPLTTSRIFKLKKGNILTVYRILRDIIRHQQSWFSRQGFRSPETVRLTQELPAASPQQADGATSVEPMATPSVDSVVSDLANATAELQFSPYMGVWVDHQNHALVVYGTPADMKRIAVLVEQLDTESTPYTSSEVIALQHASAPTIGQLLNHMVHVQRRMFERQGQSSGEVRETRDGESDMQDVFEFSPYMYIWSERTGNSVLVYGTRSDIDRIKSIIAKLDIKHAPITRSKVYYLEHADAYGLSRVVNQVIYAQRRTFQRRGLLSGEETKESTSPELQSELTMGFEFSDFATVVADRRSNSILFYGTDSDIERVDEIIDEMDIEVEPITASRVFALKHAQANTLARILQIIVASQRRAMRDVESAVEKVANRRENMPTDAAPIAEGEQAVQFSQFLSIVPDARNNAIIAYGTHSDIEYVAELIQQTDVEVAPVTRTEVFFLENASARTLSSILGRMIRSQQQAMRQVQSLFRAVQYRGKDDDVPEILYDPNESMQFSPYVSVVANDRNNSLLVYGTQADIEQLRTIIDQNDVAVAPRTQSRVFHIRHADANDVVRTINPLIASQQRARERESTMRRFFRQASGEEDDSPPDTGSAQPANTEPPPDFPFAEALEFDDDLQFSPYVSLSPDDRSNSILVYGTPFDLQQVEGLIDQIDRVLPQVRIEVVIAEVMLQEGQVSGLDRFGLSYQNPFPFQIDSAANGGVISKGAVIGGLNGLEGVNGAASDVSLGIDLFSLQTVFQTAKDDSNVRILSAPAITTTHNRPASINVGEARPIITSSTTSLDNSLASRSTLEYRDIGIELNVRPLVTEEGTIQMEIEQTVETVIDTQTIDSNEQPIIGTRRANSFVSVRDEQTIVMGGLQSEATIESEGRIWLLGDIPLLGRLFRSRRSTSTVRELIIFIRPKLVRDMTPEAFKTSMQDKQGLATDDVVTYLEEGQFAGQAKARASSKENNREKNTPAQAEQPSSEDSHHEDD